MLLDPDLAGDRAPSFIGQRVEKLPVVLHEPTEAGLRHAIISRVDTDTGASLQQAKGVSHMDRQSIAVPRGQCDHSAISSTSLDAGPATRLSRSTSSKSAMWVSW